MAALNSIAVVEKQERFESVREVRCDKLMLTRRSFARGREADAFRDCLNVISRCCGHSFVMHNSGKIFGSYFNVRAST